MLKYWMKRIASWSSLEDDGTSRFEEKLTIFLDCINLLGCRMERIAVGFPLADNKIVTGYFKCCPTGLYIIL
jgi:hypothetical protein